MRNADTLNWSWKPLFIWMKLFGFQLDGCQKNYKKWITFLGGVFLLINWVVHLLSLVSCVKNLTANRVLGKNGSTHNSNASLLNAGIEHLNYVFMVSSIHTIFFVVSLTSCWQSLWTVLREIGQSYHLKKKFYVRYRKIVVIGIIFIIFVSWITK